MPDEHTHTPVVERHVVHETRGSSSAGAAALILLIVLILGGFVLWMFGYLPFLARPDADTVEVELPSITIPDSSQNPNGN